MKVLVLLTMVVLEVVVLFLLQVVNNMLWLYRQVKQLKNVKKTLYPKKQVCWIFISPRTVATDGALVVFLFLGKQVH